MVDRPIPRLWLGQIFSSVGDQLHQVALVWIAVEAIGASAGLVVASGTAARLCFGLVGGVYADRWDRQRTMIAADVGRALAVATLAFAGLSGPLSLAHLALVAAILGVLDSLFAPSLQASLPTLVPDATALQRANALLNVNHRLARVLGPGLTGVLLSFLPITQFFAIDAASFLASALAIWTLGRQFAWKPPAVEGPRPSALREIRETLGEVARHPYLGWGLMLIGVWNLGSSIAPLRTTA
jgi:DHA3 family macrolide efflux protein-like MFS transporter